MTDGNTDPRLRMARWVIIGAFGLIALLMATVAFAGGALPGHTTTYADLPIVRVASSPVTQTVTASLTATLTPISAPKATASAASPTRAGASGGGTTKAPPSDVPVASKGKTPEEDKEREVVDPDVRVGDSQKNSSGDGTEH